MFDDTCDCVRHHRKKNFCTFTSFSKNNFPCRMKMSKAQCALLFSPLKQLKWRKFTCGEVFVRWCANCSKNITKLFTDVYEGYLLPKCTRRKETKGKEDDELPGQKYKKRKYKDFIACSASVATLTDEPQEVRKMRRYHAASPTGVAPTPHTHNLATTVISSFHEQRKATLLPVFSTV